mgnify:CR=1 FL=1
MTKTVFPSAEVSRQERYDHIAKAAANVVALKGLEALSIRSAAEEAGCSKGLVEHYFKNKMGLMNAALEWVNRTYFKRLESIPDNLSGLASLEAHIRQLLPFNKQILNEWRVRLVYWRQSSTSTELKGTQQTRFEKVFNVLMADIEAAIEQGEVDSDLNPITATELIMLYVIGFATAALNSKRLRQKDSLEARIRAIKALLTTGQLQSMADAMGDIY